MALRRTRVVVTAAAALALTSGIAVAATSPPQAGPSSDRTGVTPVGYAVTPAGTQTRLGNLPLNAALSPDGRYLLVTNNGQGTQSLQVVDTTSGDVTQTIPYAAPEALYLGLAWSPDGSRAYASAGGSNKIRTYDVAAGQLTETAAIAMPTTNPGGTKVNMFPAGLAITPDGRRLVVADQLADAVSVIDIATRATTTVAVGHRPFGVALSGDGATAYVTNQGANTLSVVDVSGAAPVVASTVTVGTHPNKLTLDREGKLLYVANGDSDEVSVVDTTSRTVRSTISLAPYRDAPVGSNPTGLALSPDGQTLYVTNSGNNDVAVVDLDKGEVRGLIPAAWYPSAVVASGDQLYVTNAKGLGAGPNNGPGFPNPERGGTAPDQYTASMMFGTLSVIPVPRNHGQLRKYTATVNKNNDFAAGAKVRGHGAGSVIPRHPGGDSPIKHVIYVVRENRTYDQVLGNLGRGNGDPTLNLFGDESAPNARELSRRFVTLDNFYADAEVSAQGWNWAVAANSNPYSEEMFPANYSPRGGPYPSENNTPEIAPNRSTDDAYIWQRLAAAGISFRNYGFYAGTNAQGQNVAADPVLNANTDPAYQAYNLSCPDSAGSWAPMSTACGSPRITEWLREFRQFEADDNLPTVQFVRLPNDHTSGTSRNKPTPKAYVADNDWALGQLVDAVSHSKYWSSTAILVTEDDAQNGPDHVDAHRTVSMVISPYSQLGKVDSTFYNTSSMLRTMELIVGIGPLTQFDAYSTPMLGSFSNQANNRSYDAIRPSYSMTTVNGAAAPLADKSEMQDLTVEDRIDMQTFNEAIWQSVKGAGSPMPAPQHNIYGGGYTGPLDEDD